MIDQLRHAMHLAGLDYSGPLEADGHLRRFKAEGDHNKNSWYVLHHGPPMAAGFGCWKRGLNETWCGARSGSMSDQDWQRVRAQWRQAEQQREKTEQDRRDQARRTAAWILQRSAPATDAHPYLSHKLVTVAGDLKVRGGELVVPLEDIDGGIHSLQFIPAYGKKMFLSGGRVSGCFFRIPGDRLKSMILCEGVATGLSIHLATGSTAICGMSAGNLMSVAQGIRSKHPEADLIIAGDNDSSEGNPGATAATGAAKAVGARLVIAMPSEGSDFNDVHVHDGLDAVRAAIDAASIVKETDKETITRLAALDPMQYERCREAEAKRMKIRTSVLDRMVEQERPDESANLNLQGDEVICPDVEPWPDPVDGSDVLASVVDTLRKYAALPPGGVDAIALWILHTHCYEAFMCTPRLNLYSPTKGCGKTTVRDVVACLVSRPMSVENMSLAVLFRVTSLRKPSLLCDEYDAWIHTNEELRGLLNSGHRRGGQALRCEGDGNDVRAFPVFAPVLLAGIGHLPGTLRDRSIVVKLDRAKPGELPQRLDSRRLKEEEIICRKIARWAKDHVETLAESDPVLPSGLFNRRADNWRPLFAIAEVVGGDWPARAATAQAALSLSEEGADAEGINGMLLEDIRLTFSQRQSTRLFSRVIVEDLVGMTDRPWPEAHHKKSKPITEVWLARRLQQFNIKPRTMRIAEDRAKGYALEDFADAFARYLPPEGESKRDTVTKQAGVPNGEFSTRDTSSQCHASESQQTPANIGLSRCHGSNTPKEGVLAI